MGTGKTTLLNKLLEWLRTQRVSTAFVFNPRLNVMEFFDFMMADFGIACEPGDKAHMLMRLNQWLLDRYRMGETAALIIDEAQNLSMEMLEEIRLLTNLETSTEKLLQIVLSGQPELEAEAARAATHGKSGNASRCAAIPIRSPRPKPRLTSRSGCAWRARMETRSSRRKRWRRSSSMPQGVPRLTNLLVRTRPHQRIR